MKKIYLMGLCYCLASSPAWASHIVGGELSLQYKQATTYVLSFNLYFDVINGEPLAEDASIYVGIFSKRTNRRVAEVELIRTNRLEIQYTNVACTYGRLRTRQIQYSREIVLEPSIYGDSEGYYISWERCCRNAATSNIINPGSSGAVFYLEFPAVTQNGQAFINNSPVFSLPKGDYACVNQPFIFEFGATDPDNDSLVYYLETPWRGNSTPTFSSPSTPSRFSPTGIFYAAPYQTITWATSINLSNTIPGKPPLRANARTGELTFTASNLGLHVFTVVCEEYRNGKKIGLVRRDYQLLIIDCPSNDPPQVRATERNQSRFYQEGEVISLPYSADSGGRCVNVLVTDPNPGQIVSLQAIGLNFPSDDLALSLTQATLQGTSDTLRASLCFKECILTTERPLLVALVASDNSCPIPRRDTLLIRVDPATKPNQPPTVVTTLVNAYAGVYVGTEIRFDVIATDVDNDVLTLKAVGRGFDLPAVGMQFSNATGSGTLTEPFRWTPSCDNRRDSAYVLDFIVEDNSCSADRFDTVTVTLQTTELDVAQEFVPANIFTPNEDGKNDCFSIPNLPPDNCDDAFRYLIIYNRWGKQVYEANEREFSWCAENFPTGVYYYLIKYRNASYKGTISLLR